MAAICAIAGALAASPASAQSSGAKSRSNTGVIADEELTLVVGTRFVSSSADATTPRALFAEARIPLTAFNETDNCIDQYALEVAKEYFTTLGRMLGKAGLYFFVPDDEIRKSVAMCERLHHRPPQAWIEQKTRIIAFGQVVPTVTAPALEESIR